MEPVDRRRQADRPGPAHPHEADERAGLGDPGGERLLRVAGVARVQDREPARGEPGGRQPRETASVEPSGHVHLERRPARPSRDDLAPVGDVQRHAARAERPSRFGERQVVDPGARERPPLRRARIEDRREVPARSAERRSTRHVEQRIAPEIACGRERPRHARRVGGTRPWRRARAVRGGRRRSRPDREDRERRDRREAREPTTVQPGSTETRDRGAFGWAVRTGRRQAGRAGARTAWL